MFMNFMLMFYIFTTFSPMSSVVGDVYLHNPRGNNNRCDERSNDRNNENRLFDSQNNAAGGYAVGCNRPENAQSEADISCYKMKYYTDTVIPIRWTAQHNCGENNDCQFIIQYACEGQLGVNIRNGEAQNTNGNTCTETIPEKTDRELEEDEGVNLLKYGKHEDYTYYQRCKGRQRNPFLFTADQKLKGQSAKYTRQNPNGNRYGFECPEERDYYPYWGESDWRDIAVLTTDMTRCDMYRDNSRCFMEKHDCLGGTKFSTTKEDCELHGGLWYTYPKFPQSECNFTCANSPSGTINRLGLGQNSTTHTEFHWKVPSIPLQNCVLRIRYNISTKETPWEFTNANNSQLKNNPVMNTTDDIPVRMAVNTAQYGRIFEDRTYTFDIIERPIELKDKIIHNVNVQGKRGNIAQVRNCIEYDFVPNNITITEDDYLHFQWLGSDYNPQGNDGEGRAGTDRSNIVLIDTHKDNLPTSQLEVEPIFDKETRKTLASLNQPINDAEQCYTFNELDKQNKRNDQQSLKNCALLNRAEPYFNMYPVKSQSQTSQKPQKIMSSRNNNFSNRGQKLTIRVLAAAAADARPKESQPSAPDTSASTNNVQVAYIAAGIIGGLVCAALIVSAIYYRNSFSKKYDSMKKNFKRSTSTYI
jgi:hypothetical protein